MRIYQADNVKEALNLAIEEKTTLHFITVEASLQAQAQAAQAQADAMEAQNAELERHNREIERRWNQ